MVDKWETNVGQLRIVGGTRLEDPPNLAIAEQRSLLPTSGRGKGRLYVLIELSGPPFGRDELEQDLADAVVEEYFHTPGTVTYGLRQAVLLANTHLLRANAQVTSEHRGGGVACVVVRDGEAFIAQAGWPVVYLAHRDQVQAFPDSLLGDEDALVLGQRQAADVHLFRAPVQPGDSILVADGAMARQLGTGRVEELTSGGIEHAIANLETLAPPQDCTAMVIRVGSEQHRAAEAEQWTFTPIEQSLTMEPPLAEAEVVPSAPPAPSLEETLDPFVDTASVEAFAASRRARQVESSGTEWVGNAFSTLVAGMRTLGERMLPDRKPSSTTPAHRRAEPAARRTTRQEPRRARQWLIVAIALPLVAVFAAVGYRSYRNWSLRNQFNEYLETATLKREIALNSTESPTVAKEYWMQVLQSLAQASTLQPENEQVPALRQEAQVAIDQIDGVVRLKPPYELYKYAVPGSKPSRVIVAGLDVYVIDRGTQRVYHHALNELRNGLRDPDADQVLVQQGQSIEGKTVGSLIDIAWIKEGGERQSGALLILDHNGLLLEYDPTWSQMHTQVIGGQEAWRTPIALQTYDANLYLLDTTANQIYKYWAGRYGEASDAWLKQGTVDLLKAVDMAIDGNIYVLHSDGILQKYFGGEMVPFALTQIPRPLIHADTFYFDVEETVKHMYLVDTLEQRLVQVDRDGVFVRQFQPERGQEALFEDLSGVFVDETGEKLYYVAGNTLYATDIPAVAE